MSGLIFDRGQCSSAALRAGRFAPGYGRGKLVGREGMLVALEPDPIIYNASSRVRVAVSKGRL